MPNNLVNLMFKIEPEPRKTNRKNHIPAPGEKPIELYEFGNDLFSSEELTDHTYQVLLDMAPDGGWWLHGQEHLTKRDFHISDIALAYLIGPYVPCTRRWTYTQSIDPQLDGIPGIRVVAAIEEKDNSIMMVRPIQKFPRCVSTLDHCHPRRAKRKCIYSVYDSGLGYLRTWETSVSVAPS